MWATVSRWSGFSAACAEWSITTAGPTRREAGTLATSWPSLPVIQWIGASKCVPTCSPTVSVYQAQAGPLSSYSLMTSRDRPGVFANGGGSWSTGVFSLSGCVRSTTSTLPFASPAMSSVTTECLLQPFGTDVGIDLRVEHHGALGVLQPLAHRAEVVRHAFAAGRAGERGEVRRRELRELDRPAQRPEVMHLGAVGGVVVDDDEQLRLQAAERLELRQRHQQPAVADRSHAQAIRTRDRRADRAAQPEPDALERLREHEAVLVGDAQVHRGPAHERAGVDRDGAFEREDLVERDRERARVDPVARLLVRLVAPAPCGDLGRELGRAAARTRRQRFHQQLRGRLRVAMDRAVHARVRAEL